MNKPTPFTKDEASRTFLALISRYGIRWTAKVPREAYDLLAKCNEVLTETDRRNLFTSEVRSLPSKGITIK
jgi:hypothetical protein